MSYLSMAAFDSCRPIYRERSVNPILPCALIWEGFVSHSSRRSDKCLEYRIAVGTRNRFGVRIWLDRAHRVNRFVVIVGFEGCPRPCFTFGDVRSLAGITKGPFRFDQRSLG